MAERPVTRKGETASAAGGQSVMPWLLATLVTLLSLIALVRLDIVERQTLQNDARTAIRSQLDIMRAKLEASISAPLLRARGMAAFIVARGDITEEEFNRVAAMLLDGHSAVRNIVVSRGMEIAMTYPLEGNEAVIGAPFSRVPEQLTNVQKAIETRASQLQGPVPLIQGGLGLIARTPVFLPGENGAPGPFFGMVNVVLDIPKVFSETGVESPGRWFQVAIRGRDGGGLSGPLVWGDDSVFADRPVVVDVQLPDGAWALAGAPVGGWKAVEDTLTTTRVLGVVVFLLIATIAFGSARHITRRATAEQALLTKTLELERSNSELERSNADLESFAYATSHDLQTPLRNIVSYAQLLERRYRGRLDADADDYIGFLVGNARRLSALVRDLLNYSRLSTPAAAQAVMPVAMAVQEALRTLEPDIAGSGAIIEVGTMPPLLTDSRLTSVFQNLIGNALRYARPGVPPHVAVTAERSATVPAHWVLSVADNGIGIEPQYFERIFNLFQRLESNDNDGGSGVGLAVCKRIVHQYGGEIWVESVPGQGSVFRFTLPATAAEDDTAAPPVALAS